ncbi:uncharacterized protein HaLaN_17590 [Haematococcus lacustris]|uniref:Uncharacterized protein n=1 Tax=Haematococcus lacustris TaxID=44745 RepID=A0A699ZF02_HAELA|nr:uncharacterized protein HaLaN_17590 [Haematococcus lacustris]
MGEEPSVVALQANLANGLLAVNLNGNGHVDPTHADSAYGDYRKMVFNVMQRLCVGGKEAVAAADEVATTVLGSGISSLDGFGFALELRSAAEDSGNAGAREGALLAYKAISAHVGRPAEPWLVPLIPIMLERHADKAPPVRAAAEAAADTVVASLNPASATVVIQLMGQYILPRTLASYKPCVVSALATCLRRPLAYTRQCPVHPVHRPG